MLDPVRTGWATLGQFMSCYDRLGQFKSGKFTLCQVRLLWVILSQVNPVYDRLVPVMS